MENPSHPVSKKPYNANGFGPKTVYDDVFGGPSKFGVPTLSPRVEDYAEIFGNFNGCRGSSIPILELPAAVDEVDLSFDFPKSKLDYSEVFGGFNGLGFATSFDQLYNDPKPAYDSSDEAWTPAESGSLSDESEPSACSERNRSLINEEPFQSSDSNTQFNISYNKASRRNKEELSNGMAHTTQVHAVPGFSYIVDETICPKKTQGGDSLLRVADHLIPNVEINKGLREKKQLRKATSEISNSSFCKQASRQPFTADCMDESFLSLSDINLRTRPSELPPPSRPPPPLARAGDSDQQKSKLEASKSFAYGETKGDNSPPFFDVEIDARSSAAVSDAAMRDAMEMAKAKLKSAKESQAKKLSRKCTADMDLGVEVGKESKPFNESNCIKDEKHHGTFTGVERLKGARAAHVFSDVNEGGSNKNLTEVCAEKKHGKACRPSLESYQTEGTVAWREEASFFEVVKTDKSQQIFDQSKDENSHTNNIQVRGDGLGKKATPSFQEKEDEDYREIEGLNHERNENKRRVGKNQKSVRHEELENNLKLNPEEKKNKPRMTKQRTVREKIPSSSDTNKELENLEGIQMKGNEVKVEKKSKKRTGDKKHHDAHVREEKARRPRESLEGEGYEKRIERSIEEAKIDKGLDRSLDHKELEKEGREAHERIKKEKKQEPCKTVENEKIPGHALKDEENDGLRVSLEQDEAERKLRISVERGEEKHHKEDQNEMRLLQETRRKEKKVEACLQKEEISGKQMDAVKGEETPEIQSGSCRREEKVEEPVEVLQQNENHEREESGKEDMKQREGEICSQESAECEATQKTDRDVEYGNESKGCIHYYNQDATDEVERKVNSTDGFCVASEDLNASNGACEVDDNMNLHAGEADCKDEENGVEVKTTRTAFSFSGDRTMRDEPMGSEGQVEALQKVNVLSEEQFASSGTSPEDSLHLKEQVRMRDSNESFNVQYTGRDSDKAGVVKGQMPMDANKVSSNLGMPNGLTHELGVKVGASVREAEVQFDEEVRKSKVFPSQVVRKLGEDKEKMGAHQSAGLEKKPNGQKIRTTQKVRKNQEPERKEKNLTPEDREKEERLKREKELEEDRLRKIEEEREREREREKDRMAVDRATLEASEKAFGETRERSSVGRVTAEVRQRMMAEARERLEKASAEARERLSGDKVSTESRLRAERAAVERATAEARERAFQKAMVEKATIEARERAGNLNAEKFSSAYKSGGMRNDPHDMQSQSVGPNTSYVYSSIHGGSTFNTKRFVGADGESPQRCKARLERHQRTAERAAKALAEKNMRDLLAQREQAERNRFAEYLDVEVKRWSSGKEGNLRALVSTLQYILGPESGWQPIPLTEVITSAAVKKAYRKATLCVHPDKLQQRGASIQHKYICEKVFDLLKEAWNRFNSEER